MKLHRQTTYLPQDPLAVFEPLAAQHEHCFLLETLTDTDQAHTTGQSYIGVAPKRVLSARAGMFYIDGQARPGVNPYTALAAELTGDRQLAAAGYAGGLVGYLSHEAIHYLEPVETFGYARQFDDFQFGEYEDGLIFRPGQPVEYFYRTVNRLKRYQPPAIDQVADLQIEYHGAKHSRVHYETMIRRARQDIRSGRVFQVILANKYDYSFHGDLLQLYKQLRRINPSPFMFFIKCGEMITMGASPELLLHATPHGTVYLEALAGTIRRGRSVADDERLARQLLSDEKELAEHRMMVDLARNDVGRVSRLGSVNVNSLMYIKQLSHVQHISSILSGRLETGRTAFDALAAAFPAGTLTGAPKLEAIKMITELEACERGPYGGTVGYFSYNGDAMHAVNIRSVHAQGDQLVTFSGSGVVFDSQAAREYQEIADKQAAINQAMQPFLRPGR